MQTNLPHTYDMSALLEQILEQAINNFLHASTTDIHRRLDSITTQLGRIDQTMSQFAANVQQLITAINTETDAIASKITALQQQLQDADTPDQKTAIVNQLGQISSRLQVLGSDPTNPIPGGPTGGDVAAGNASSVPVPAAV